MLDAESEKECGRLVNYLAGKYQESSFLPHITLGGVPDWPDKNIKSALERIVGATAPFELHTKSVQCKSSPYQKVTLAIESSSELHRLHQKTDTVLKGDYSKKEYPHISFLYSSLSCEKLQDEVYEIEKIKPQKVAIKEIALFHCKGTPDKWRMLYTCRLPERSV